MLMEEVVEEGCNRVDGKGKRETRLHSLEMRMVTMATAAESHMMRRSEREREMDKRVQKKKQAEGGAFSSASRRQRRRGRKYRRWRDGLQEV